MATTAKSLLSPSPGQPSPIAAFPTLADNAFARRVVTVVHEP
jgi:hypothetical protein